MSSIQTHVNQTLALLSDTCIVNGRHHEQHLVHCVIMLFVISIFKV